MDATLRLLGQFSLADADGPMAIDIQSSRLVAALALSGPMDRGDLARRLWTDASRKRALANVRTVLWRMPAPVRSLIVGRCRELALDDSVDVDVHRMCLRGRTGGRSGTPPVGSSDPSTSDIALGFDLDQLSAPLLSGWYDEWVIDERERIRRCQVEMLRRRAAAHLEAGNAAAAVIDATWAVTVDPLNEPAHQLLLLSHLAEGNVNEAVRHFTELQQMLDTELGVRPFGETVRIMAPCLL